MIKLLFKSVYYIIFAALWLISLIISAMFGMVAPVLGVGLVILLIYFGAKRICTF
ncbi:hypothetical protein BH09DEP1_BH09DEP1_5170 [soil metagenome]